MYRTDRFKGIMGSVEQITEYQVEQSFRWPEKPSCSRDQQNFNRRERLDNGYRDHLSLFPAPSPHRRSAFVSNLQRLSPMRSWLKLVGLAFDHGTWMLALLGLPWRGPFCVLSPSVHAAVPTSIGPTEHSVRGLVRRKLSLLARYFRGIPF